MNSNVATSTLYMNNCDMETHSIKDMIFTVIYDLHILQ
jgi:hypothetical protein